MTTTDPQTSFRVSKRERKGAMLCIIEQYVEICNADLCAGGSWQSSEVCQKVDVPQGLSNFTVTLTATATEIKLWWPAGVGAQPRYDISELRGEYIRICSPFFKKKRDLRNVAEKLML